jgi:hypothetical protein
MLPPDLISTLKKCADTDFSHWRHLWFSRQFWFSIAVIVGLILELPELVYEMRSIVRSRIRRYRYGIVILESRVELAKAAAFIGWLFIVGGLFGELRAGTRIEDLSASIQECSEAKVRAATLEAGDAGDSAKKAHNESTAAKAEADAAKLSAGEALTRAQTAERSLAKAENDAGKAQTVASNALTTATDASNRAGKAEASLGKTEAEARNAETSASNALTLARAARRETDSFEQELARIRFPRTLIRQSEFNLKMGQFVGTEYTFESVFQDEESIAFLRLLDAALQDAGWRRVTPPGGFPAINVFGTAENFSVPVGFGTGVTVAVESNESLSSLRTTPETTLPPNVRAAVALNKALSWSISPKEEIEPLASVGVKSGTSTTVRIMVGKKK